MLSFTRAGAVATPTTLQIRVTRQFPGRIAAGAPSPSRSLSLDELRANLAHFTEGMRGPRTRPCTALVLSGLDLSAAPELSEILADARRLGVERVTVHASAAHPPSAGWLAEDVDAVALTLRSLEECGAVAQWRGEGTHVAAVVPLVAEVLARADALARAIAAAGPDRVVLTWPFPPGAPPAPAAEAATAVPGMLAILDEAGVAAGVKGLPACALGSADRLWRSANRWYVDAEHQLGDALLFFPDVVRFAKDDACRYCAAEGRCDGAPEAWLRDGLAGILTPLAE